MLLLLAAVMYCQSARLWTAGGLATEPHQISAQEVGTLLNFKI